LLPQSTETEPSVDAEERVREQCRGGLKMHDAFESADFCRWSEHTVGTLAIHAYTSHVVILSLCAVAVDVERSNQLRYRFTTVL